MGRNVTSNDQGSNEVGELVPFDTVVPKFVVGGRTYLRTGVLDDMANYPDFPAELGGGKYATFELSNALPVTTGWSGLAYGAGVYVTVSDPQALSTDAATSPDGITWTAQTLPASARWVSVAFGNGVFAAVAGGNSTSNLAASSPDGTTWTARTLPVTTGWQSVCYGDKFVAVSNGINAATSLDGITWTARTMASSAAWQDIAWSGERYVAVSGGSSPSAVAAYSDDGMTWVPSTLPVAARWKSVAYGNGVFVAIAGGNTTSTVAATSVDGITWIQREVPSGVWTSVRFGDGVFIAGGLASTVATSSDYAVSSDGITWTKRKSGISAVAANTVITGIVATPGKVVMMSGRSTYGGGAVQLAAQTSTDTVERSPTTLAVATSDTPTLPLYMRMK